MMINKIAPLLKLCPRRVSRFFFSGDSPVREGQLTRIQKLLCTPIHTLKTHLLY